jgi:hypothetical protein
MKTSVYLRPSRKSLEHFPKLGDPAPIEATLDVTRTTIRRAVLHIQKGHAQAVRPHRVIDSDDEAQFAFTDPALVTF